MKKIAANGLEFDADVAGDPAAPLVLLLHGFPQTSHTWRDVLPALADDGWLAVAPNQRGYSPGARPRAPDAYATPNLVADALAIADALGRRRFQLVGHDWGGQLAWLVAGAHPDRVETLTVLSRPHPRAFAAAFASDPEQAARSRHHRAFRDPATARRLLADGARALRQTLAAQGVADADARAYLEVLGTEEALDAALAWYRAADLARPDAPPVAAPTLYVWGDADATVGRAAADATAGWVTGPYRFEVLPGVGHFVTDEAAARVVALLRAHLAAHASR